MEERSSKQRSGLKEFNEMKKCKGSSSDKRSSGRANCLPRAPWWGGQFELLIGVVERSFNKTIGVTTLTWDELSDVLLDVEVQINRRPLSYVDDDVQLPILTPSAFLFQRSNSLPEQEPWREENVDLRRRGKYLRSLTALRERHNLNHKRKNFEVAVGDIVLIKAEDKNRNKWPMGVVQQIYPGRDGVVRAVQVHTATGKLERPIQHLYPMELSCDRSEPPELNPLAEDFRPRRQAAAVAAENIRAIALHEQV
ncbi:uncharacterized protein [Montipora foliosa]|uniref:uncharacterized protein n=1 Tax=Montipora foliosa TaxID=591990 RepID=UPI0035F1A51F